MTVSRTRIESKYMQWAKLQSTAPLNLATSAVGSLSLADLPLKLEDLELDTHGSYGYAPLLERLARYTGVDTECIVTAPGTSMANALAMAGAFEPGDEVLFERPTYEPMLTTAQFLGAEVRRFERRRENGFRVDPDEIRKQITPRTRLIVLANLHNPTSALTSEDDLRAVGEIAREAGARVLVDEVYLEDLFDRRPRVALQLGPQFITTSSLTKAYGLGGLRCGWVLAEPELARRIWHIRDVLDVNSAHPAEGISVVVMDHLEQLAERSQALLRTNRPIAQRFLEEHPEMVTLRPEFGTVYTLRAPGGDADAFCKHLREHYDTSVVPGRFFELPDCFRLGIGGNTDALRQGLARLTAAVEDFTKRGA
ncbi:MAG: aminotransferase class I/II-fold pyridoxal phosphate-dependent enzyme [Acidobacteriota bacterium]|nr:aminotransferase class I/II-fold pyridoxal phosphate-dependent enzyme [Acidobacteriota bacterium]